eukprot:1154151-Ditylum_brightwellii.AAC.1
MKVTTKMNSVRNPMMNSMSEQGHNDMHTPSRAIISTSLSFISTPIIVTHIFLFHCVIGKDIKKL